MSSRKTHMLKSDNNFECFALGITSSETEFQLSLTLNSFLSVKLTIASPIEKIEQKTSTTFSSFRYDNEENLQLVLIKNKKNRFILFPNLKSFDYLILLSGEEAKNTVNSMISSVKNLPNISLISAIDTKKIRNCISYFS